MAVVFGCDTDVVIARVGDGVELVGDAESERAGLDTGSGLEATAEAGDVLVDVFGGSGDCHCGTFSSEVAGMCERVRKGEDGEG